jgi:hypothetical protein
MTTPGKNIKEVLARLEAIEGELSPKEYRSVEVRHPVLFRVCSKNAVYLDSQPTSG